MEKPLYEQQMQTESAEVKLQKPSQTQQHKKQEACKSDSAASPLQNFKQVITN